MRVLELFCGIGGCAAALDARVAEVLAVDQSPIALRTYRANFPRHRVLELHLAAARTLPEADLWWLSPPCQPYTIKGRRRDLDDPRAASLVRVLELLAAAPPRELALENVPGFRGSRAHARLREVLDECGFLVAEQELCPTQLGVPNRRRRFFVAASRLGPPAPPRRAGAVSALADHLDPEPDPELDVEPALLRRYEGALEVVDPADPGAIATCFASAYGRSPVRSGSYVLGPRGPRRFSPAEILRLLGFPAGFGFAPGTSRRQAWALAGNSLCVPAVRAVLATLPGYAADVVRDDDPEGMA